MGLSIYLYIQEYMGAYFFLLFALLYIGIPEDFVRSVACVCFVPFCRAHIHEYNSLDGQPDILRSLYSALQPSSTLEDPRYNCTRHSKYTHGPFGSFHLKKLKST